MHSQELTLAEIAALLKNNARHFPPLDPFPENYFTTEPRAASVLVPLFRDNNEWNLLFIRRSEQPRDRHSGQVAFPGGKVDKEDKDTVAAALRECYEEIGISLENINILGCLSNYRTVSNFLVTPVVASIAWPIELTIDRGEVHRAFSIPLKWLAYPENLHIQERPLPDFDVAIPVYYYQRYDDELLWGITAKITVSLLSSLGLLQGPA